MLYVPGNSLVRKDRGCGSGKIQGGSQIAYIKEGTKVEWLIDKCVCAPNIETLVLKLCLKMLDIFLSLLSIGHLVAVSHSLLKIRTN